MSEQVGKTIYHNEPFEEGVVSDLNLDFEDLLQFKEVDTVRSFDEMMEIEEATQAYILENINAQHITIKYRWSNYDGPITIN